MNTQLKQLVVACTFAFAAGAQAAVTADEAKALGTTLTPVGAEKGANKDGTIPAYTGGMTTPPAASRPATASARTRSPARSRSSRSTPSRWRSTPTS